MIVQFFVTVSHDKNVERLLHTHSPDLVISSGGLKRLMDNTGFKNHWEIPVVVKEIERGELKLKLHHFLLVTVHSSLAGIDD